MNAIHDTKNHKITSTAKLKLIAQNTEIIVINLKFILAELHHFSFNHFHHDDKGRIVWFLQSLISKFKKNPLHYFDVFPLNADILIYFLLFHVCKYRHKINCRDVKILVKCDLRTQGHSGQETRLPVSLPLEKYFNALTMIGIGFPVAFITLVSLKC